MMSYVVELSIWERVDACVPNDFGQMAATRKKKAKEKVTTD